MQSEEVIHGGKRVNSNVLNSVILFLGNQCHGASPALSMKEAIELFKEIALKLNNETRFAFLNALVNELRYPNSHTYTYSCIILYLFNDANSESVQEQISRIMFERLQVNKPHPWGLMISFREMIQNPKFGFMQKPFIVNNLAAVNHLFATKLASFQPFVSQPDGLQKE
mmetsp:Transcript_48325/g.35512  ORF Transcript_48325/g.35512 Transcript_48325/m.35512 type:complete len:169 (+) Transcript_48325:1565-2071(+)